MSNPIPTVGQYMTRLPHTIVPTATLERAHKVMRKHLIRHLPVLSDGQVVGILSLRDLHLIETLEDVDQTEVPVADAMTDKPYIVGPDTPLDDVAAKMAASKIGSAVVMEHGEVAGIFTTIDALVALLHVWKRAP